MTARRRANVVGAIVGTLAMILAGPAVAMIASLTAIVAVMADAAACDWYARRG